MRKLIVGLSAVCGLMVASLATQGADEEKSAETKKIEPAEVNLGRPVDFDRDIMPVLEKKCIACHNIAINEGKLSLEDVESVMQGGKRGPAVVPKQPDKSRLFLFASRAAKPAMPPLPNQVDAAALTPKELGLFRQWILEGATKGGGTSQSNVQWQPLPASLNSVYSVALSPWGRFAAAGRANQISIYDLASKEKVARLVDPNLGDAQYNGGPMYPAGAAHRDFVHSLVFSPDGTMLASGGYRVVKLWQRETRPQRHRLSLGKEITAAAVSADGKWAALAAADNTIRLWNLVDGKPGKTLSGHTKPVTGLEFWPHPQEQAEVTRRVSETAAEVDSALRKLATARKALSEFGAHPDPKLDAEATQAKKDQLTAAQTSAEEASKTAQQAAQTAREAKAAFDKKAAEEGRLFSVSADKSVRVWKPADGSPIAQLETPAAANDVAVNRDGTQFVTAEADNMLRVWAYPIVQPQPADEAKKDDAKNDDQKDDEKNQADEAKIAPLRELQGHGQPVTSVALLFTPGTQVVSGSSDGTARLWDLTNGNQIRSMNHGGPVVAVAASPDGQRVGSVSDNNTGKLWQTSNGQQVAELKGDVNKQRWVLDRTEEQTVATQRVGLADNAVNAADKNMKDRQEAEKKAQEAKNNADKAVVEPQKKAKEAQDKLTAAKTNQVETAKTFKEAQDAAAKAVKERDEAVKQAAADEEALKKAQDALQAAEKKATEAEAAAKKAAEAKKAADKGDDENAKKQTAKEAADAQAAAKKAADELAAAKTAVANAEAAAKASAEAKTKAEAAVKQAENTVKQTDDANKAAVKAVDDAQKAFDTADAALQKVKDAQEQAQRSLDLAKKAVMAAKAKLDEANKEKEEADAYKNQIDQQVAEAQEADKAAPKPMRAVAFSPDGKRIVTAGDGGALHLWDGTTGQPLSALEAHEAPVTAVAYGSDGVIVTGSDDKNAAAWNARPTWKLVGQLGPNAENPLDLGPSPFANRVLALDFSRDGKLLATGGGDPSRTGELMIWDVKSRQLVRNIEDAHSDTVMGVEFSRDGKMLVSGAADKFVKTFDVSTGKLIRSYEGHTHHVLDVSMRADGSTIVSAGADNVIKVWNADTGEQRRTISNHSKQVVSLSFIGTTDNFVSCSGDQSVRLFTASNGRSNRSFSGNNDYVYAADCARDQSIVIAGGADGVLRVWNAQNGQSIATFDPPPPPVTASESLASADAGK